MGSSLEGIANVVEWLGAMRHIHAMAGDGMKLAVPHRAARTTKLRPPHQIEIAFLTVTHPQPNKPN
jgi:hypothetical protein